MSTFVLAIVFFPLFILSCSLSHTHTRARQNCSSVGTREKRCVRAFFKRNFSRWDGTTESIITTRGRMTAMAQSFCRKWYYARNWFILFKNWNICRRLSLGYLLQNPTQQRRKSNQNIASSNGCVWVAGRMSVLFAWLWRSACKLRHTHFRVFQREHREQRRRAKWATSQKVEKSNPKHSKRKWK